MPNQTSKANNSGRQATVMVTTAPVPPNLERLFTEVLEKDLAPPKEPPKAPLVQYWREHKELLEHKAEQFGVKLKTRIICCAAKLINLFEHWRDWKIPLYRTGWIYHTLASLREELACEHSIHVIRVALTFLDDIGFLHRRQNDRATNWRNGQDRTYQYLIRTDRIVQELRALSQTRTTAPFVNIEIPTDSFDTPAVTDDIHTQIPTTTSFPSSLSQSEQDPWFEQEELMDHAPSPAQSVDFTDKESLSTTEQLSNFPNYSAAPVTKINQMGKSALAGFESQDERERFYQSLLELGKHKGGVRSPVAWANQIIKSVNAGEPCEYLNEYRRGELVGSCEKHEWEIVPGRPFPDFVSYLKRKLEASHMTPEQATKAVFKSLSDVNEARTLWEGYKRHIANLKDEWDSQRALGVTTPYIPPEVLPEREVTLEQAAEAMQSLKGSATQMPVLGRAKVEPEPLAAVSESVEPEDVELTQEQEQEQNPEREQRLKAQVERMRGYLTSGNVFLQRCARKFLATNPDIAALVDAGASSHSSSDTEESVSDVTSPLLPLPEKPSIGVVNSTQLEEPPVEITLVGEPLLTPATDSPGLVDERSNETESTARDEEAQNSCTAVADLVGDNAPEAPVECNPVEPQPENNKPKRQTKHTRIYQGLTSATGLVNRRLAMIKPGTEVEVMRGLKHSDARMVFVRPIGADWRDGIAVLRSSLITIEPI